LVSAFITSGATSMPALPAQERFLHERFGAQYDDYTRRVRRWL
jgi:protein-S-isoprenylcysteine O-methyltransferase Ste14